MYYIETTPPHFNYDVIVGFECDGKVNTTICAFSKEDIQLSKEDMSFVQSEVDAEIVNK
jgi:hypothetical protein